MADVQELRRREARAQRAEQIVNDPLVKEAFDAIEQELFQGFMNTRGDDEEGRHNAYLMGRLLRNFRAKFKEIMVKGKSATAELATIEKANQSRKD